MSRISKEVYAIRLAYTAASRSEDPYLKVGAIAMTKNGRIIAAGYNGLPEKYAVLPSFWEDREIRLKYMIHAEQNLMSLVKKGEAHSVAVTIKPCPSCMILLIAHGIYTVYYAEDYERDKTSDTNLIAQKYGVKLCMISPSCPA